MRALLTLLLLLPMAGTAADRLHGTWQSDHEQTMRFVRAHTLLEPQQSDFLDGYLGRVRIHYDATTYRYTMPDLDIRIGGKPRHFAGMDATYRYRILGADQDSISLMLEQHHGRDRIIHIHFVGDDAFWIYSGESEYGIDDLNYREYFRRVE